MCLGPPCGTTDEMPTALDEDAALAVLRYVVRKYGRQEMAAQEAIAALERDTFARQKHLITDPARRIACRTGRRGGKTTSLERKMLRSALRAPNSFSCYIALTRRNAKLLLWPELLVLNDRYKIGGIPNRSDLTLTLPNGHIIFMGGADTAGEIDKYRQFRYTTAAIDEAGTFGPWLQDLVEAVIEPATIETKGQILICGTPGPVCEGYYYDITGNPETPERHVKQHRWTLLDNPFIKNAEAELRRIIGDRGWDPEHPTLLREYYGEWVSDHTQLVYHFAPDMLWDGVLPQARWPWEHTLSVDVGYDDPTAFALIAHNRESPNCYVRKAWKEYGWTPTPIANEIERVCREHKVTRIVADLSGGTAKGQAEEWRKRFRIPLHMPPHKNLKKEHIALMNDDAREGKVFVHESACADLIREYQTVCWDAKRKEPDPKYANDCLDAVEYGWASSLHYAAKEPPPPRSSLSPEERYAREEAEIEERMQRASRQRSRLQP